MILPKAVLLLFAMLDPLSSSETPFRLPSCATTPFSVSYIVSQNDLKVVCAPISSAWTVELSWLGLVGEALFNASSPNGLCVVNNHAVFFQGSLGFASNRTTLKLTICHVSDMVCVDMNLFASPGIYTLNSTVIAGGATTEPLWVTFGIKNLDLYVCDSVLHTPVNVTVYPVMGCVYLDSYPAQYIRLQHTPSLPPRTYSIFLSNDTCDGAGVKSDPLTLIVTSSVTDIVSTALASSSNTATTSTYVTMTTSSTPSASNTAMANARGAFPLGAGVGIGVAGGTAVVLCILVTLVLSLRSRLCTKTRDQDGVVPVLQSFTGRAPEGYELNALREENKHDVCVVSRSEQSAPTCETTQQSVAHGTIAVGNLDQPCCQSSPTKNVIVIAEEGDKRWYSELTDNLARHHCCKPLFMFWKELTSRDKGDLCQSIYQLLAQEDCEQVYVVWKGPLEQKQSSDFHSAVCTLETRPSLKKLGLVQIGTSTLYGKDCGHFKRIALEASNGTDVCASTIYKTFVTNGQTSPPDGTQSMLEQIKSTQDMHTVLLKKIAGTTDTDSDKLQTVDKKIDNLTAECRQRIDAEQNKIANNTFDI